MSELIAAVATGPVRAAVGIVRLSGEGAIDCVDRVFRARRGRKMADTPPGRSVYGGVYGADGALLDTCLCTVSRAPRSYTGEDTAELSCHGSPAALAAVLTALFENGARQARPGEFTKRAFLNGKLDLTEAEAVIDLIDADTQAAAKNAAGQLTGAVTRKTDAVYSELLDVAAHFHAVVDWPDEDIEDFRLEAYRGTLERGERTLRGLLDTFQRGRLLRDGVRTAIVGRPNVGKSSLLNALVGFDRAIVTDVPGTTRDTVEETCVLGGVKLRLADTAGLRRTDDAVEKLGVERSLDAMERAELILAVLDLSAPFTQEDARIVERAASTARTVLVLNKADLPQKLVLPPEARALPRAALCARTGEGTRELSALVEGLFPRPEGVAEGEILTNARQAGEVQTALDALREAGEAIRDGVTPDAVLTLLEEAMEALGRLSGRALASDVTDRIFERFCVGK